MEMKKTNQLSMTQILQSNGAKALAQNLQLTKDQLMKANSAALTLSSNPVLKNCDNYSKLKYCYEIARYNFTRDDCVYPVPYGNSIQAQIGYKGFRELALKSGEYADINCVKVYDCDKVKRDRNTGTILIEFEEDYLKTKGAKVIGYYAYALDKEKREICNSKFWTKEECENHGKYYSKTYNSLWGKNEYSFDKMALKTVLKQLTNELKTTPALENAKKLDGYVYGEGYADNPQNKRLVKSEVDEVFDTTIDEESEGDFIEEESESNEE